MCRAKICDETTGAALSSTISEFMFVPSGAKVPTAGELLAVVKNKWKLPMANMLINCDAGSMHPKVSGEYVYEKVFSCLSSST